jgi:hypothetical protein
MSYDEFDEFDEFDEDIEITYRRKSSRRSAGLEGPTGYDPPRGTGNLPMFPLP